MVRGQARSVEPEAVTWSATPVALAVLTGRLATRHAGREWLQQPWP